MKYQLKVTWRMLIRNLATDLYSPGQSLMELIRNGAVACMPDPESWNPALAKVQVDLVEKHPLTGGRALVVIDRGCGMTDPALKRYFGWLGTPDDTAKEHANGTHMGAAQKGMGRFAALAQNKHCHIEDEDAARHGYYLFSRTSSSGKIRYIPVTALGFEEGIEIESFIESDAAEAKFLGNIQGSFTAIVIPTPVFEKVEDVYDAIKWLLPREEDKMYGLTINGKPVQPPRIKVKHTITSKDGSFRARIGVGNPDCDGLWLCDSATGQRVTSCMRLHRLIPEVLGFPDLAGDIFAPGLLSRQNPARDSLSRFYTRKDNKEWQRLLMFLVSQVAPKAKELVDMEDIEEDTAKLLNDIVDMFYERYGPPEKQERPDPKPNPNPEPKKPGKGGKKRWERCVSIKVRNKTYRLYYNMPLDPEVFAMPSLVNRDMIMVNARGPYVALPDGKEAVREHCLMQILLAIGAVENNHVHHAAVKFANTIRSEFKRKVARK